jgi:nitroimidazol reductase NimA-like FMN-containing flavoprotein (pyridoxamine 5'-phosphate oxidase superfamily)
MPQPPAPLDPSIGHPPSKHTEVKRAAHRARYDTETIHAILDEGLVCHVGFVHEDRTFVIPTAYVRIGETLYLHGSPASQMLRSLEKGGPICVTVTLLDGVVLARSAFHTSMNYRSVVVLGQARRVRDDAEKGRVLSALVEHVCPGRLAEVRLPSEEERRFTKLLAVPLGEASAKVRTGGPIDDAEDMAWPSWAGVLPLVLATRTPVPDDGLPDPRPAPPYVTGYRRGRPI